MQLTVEFFRINQYGCVRTYIKDVPFRDAVRRIFCGNKTVTDNQMRQIKELFALAGVELTFKEVPAYEGIPM